MIGGCPHPSLSRRIRNLVLFGLAATAVVVGGLWLTRDPLIRHAFGVNVDRGPGGRAELTVPTGYAAHIFAEGLAGPRFMDVSPDGVLFVAERGADRIVALPDRDGDGQADAVVEVGAGYEHAHSVAFDGSGRLLVAGESRVFRVVVGPDLRERSREVVRDGLPQGGGHRTRTVAVLPDGDLLVSIGSSCDVSEEEDQRRGAIVRLAPDGSNERIFMRGLRNAVGLIVDPATGRAWATNMGRDRLGDDRPPETLYEVIEGADAGWPRCHAGTLVDPDFGHRASPHDGRIGCDGVAHPAATFQAHAAPLALALWRDHLVIAFHGSWNRSSKVGYDLRWLPWDGEPAGPASVLAGGFLPEGADDALGRPAGLAVGADGALYVSDDKAGFIYRIAPVAAGS